MLNVFVKKERLTSLVESKVRIATGCEGVQMGVWDCKKTILELRRAARRRPQTVSQQLQLQAAEGQNWDAPSPRV